MPPTHTPLPRLKKRPRATEPDSPAVQAEAADDALRARYEAELRISKHHLDDHLETQAALSQEVGDRTARYNYLRDQAKAEIPKIDAALDAQYRRDRGEDGKPYSETRLKHLIEGDPRHLAAVAQHLKAKYVAERWQALRDGYSDRSYSIKELGELYRSDYYTTRDIRETATSVEQATYKQDRDRLTAARTRGSAGSGSA